MSVDDVTAQVRALVDELIPTDARVAVQPSGGALVNVPTIVRAEGGREPITQQFFVSGFAVQVTARPVRWTWTFDAGVTRAFPFPGEPYADGVDPATSGRHATHSYSRAGERSLGLVVTWEAEYSLAGVGTAPVGQVERASPGVELQVFSARSELVAG